LSLLVLSRDVIHLTPPPVTLPGFHPLLFLHTRLETVGNRYVSGTFSLPIVLFCPSIVCFVSSNIYGAAPCAPIPHCRPALRIAKRLSLFFAMMEEAMPFTLQNSVERATFHRIPPMLVFGMSTLSVSRSMVSMFVRCTFLTSP
jgi:hypothetical protein